MSHLELQSITKRWPDGTVAVDDLDLWAEAGELLVLVGPSGCGKTTTLRMVAGLETPSAGMIRLADRDITRTPARDRDVAMVFQNYALYPHMTVQENVGFGLKLRGIAKTEIQSRTTWAAETLGLTETLDRKPKALSGGQRQRVALARAIVRRPALFLFDEPLSNLDAKLRTATRAELKRLQRKLGVTGLYVTHDQEEAMTLGDRVAVMNGGRLQQVADPLTVYRQPANLFVARFLGSPEINTFPAEIDSEDGRPVIKTADFTVPLTEPIPQPVSGNLPAKSHTVAVRPEGVSWSRTDSENVPQGSAIGTVELVEPLGAEMIVSVRLPSGEPLRLKSPTEPLAIGDRLAMTILSGQLHLFDPIGDRMSIGSADPISSSVPSS